MGDLALQDDDFILSNVNTLAPEGQFLGFQLAQKQAEAS